jgi:hypothetical protein
MVYGPSYRRLFIALVLSILASLWLHNTVEAQGGGVGVPVTRGPSTGIFTGVPPGNLIP